MNFLVMSQNSLNYELETVFVRKGTQEVHVLFGNIDFDLVEICMLPYFRPVKRYICEIFSFESGRPKIEAGNSF